MNLRIPFSIVAGLLLCACSKKNPEERALSPQDSLKAIHMSDDFHVELFASEPKVMSPVEMVFDESGNIYVAEMMDYPDDPPAGKPARSRIRLLRDTGGDGTYATATIFADHVLAVSGIMPWKGGLIVTSAPDILYMKDTDGETARPTSRRFFLHGVPGSRIMKAPHHQSQARGGQLDRLLQQREQRPRHFAQAS